MNSSLDGSFLKAGFLAVYPGCMFAGKTRRLIMKLSKKQDLGFKVCYVTHGDDERITKGTNLSITTHWSCFANATVPFDCYRASDLKNIMPEIMKYDVIGIDEFQFYDLDKEVSPTVDIIKNLVEHDHKIVYCVGLDTNFKRERFGHILELSLFADKYKKIRAKCEECRKLLSTLTLSNLSPHAALVPASFTAKIGGNLHVDKEAGGGDKYIPLCRYHYLNYATLNGLRA
jgi:thymidine kinase